MHIHWLKFINACMHYLFAYNHDENLLGVHYFVYTCLYSVSGDMCAHMDALNLSVCVCVYILCEYVYASTLVI